MLQFHLLSYKDLFYPIRGVATRPARPFQIMDNEARYLAGKYKQEYDEELLFHGIVYNDKNIEMAVVSVLQTNNEINDNVITDNGVWSGYLILWRRSLLRHLEDPEQNEGHTKT